MDMIRLSNAVETRSAATSAAHNLMGKQIRATALVKGQLYIMVDHTRLRRQCDLNPYSLVRFIGVGVTEHNLLDKNPTIAALARSAVQPYYWLSQIDQGITQQGREYTYSAYAFNGRLCIGSSADPVTFYEINMLEDNG